MLPFDNKNEFQVVVDMPEGSTLEKTSAVTREIANYLSQRPEVENYQSYVVPLLLLHLMVWSVITIYEAAQIWLIFK